MKILIFISLLLMYALAASKEVDLKHLKCLVCRAVMYEIDIELSKVNPNKLVDIGSYRMDATGNFINRKIPLAQSEIHISDTLDDICQKMTNYVRAIKKSNKQLTIINIMSPSGSMNPEMSKVDIIQDGDLNKSLEHYCGMIVEEYEDNIVSLYVHDKENKKEKLCTEISNICNENYIDDDDDNIYDNTINPEEFAFEDKDEL